MRASHADRRRTTFSTHTAAESTTSETSESSARSYHHVPLARIPQYQNGTSFTRSSDQISTASSEPVTTAHRLQYIRNLIGQRPTEQGIRPYGTHILAEEASQSAVYRSDVTSEFSAPSTTGYPTHYSEEMENESYADPLRPWETSELYKSDSRDDGSKESILSSVSHAENISTVTRATFAASALVLFSTTAVAAFYTYGAFSHKASSLKAAPVDQFEPPSIYHAAFNVHHDTRSTKPGSEMATEHVVRDLVTRTATNANTPEPFTDDDDLGKTTVEAPRSRKKVAVWEGKRIYEAEHVGDHTGSQSSPGRVKGVRATQNIHIAKSQPPKMLRGVVQHALVTSKKASLYTAESTTKRRTRTRVTLSNKNGKFCETKVCERESVYLISYLDWSVKPCTNFYDFVCGHWKNLHPEIGSSIDTLLVRRVEEDIYQTFTNEEKPKSQMLKTEALINTCVNKPFSEDHTSTLLDFMGDLGLRGWPFQKDTKTLADVWRAASSLLRQLGLATLVSVSVDADPDSDDKYIISLGEPSLLIGQYGTKNSQLPEWYSMAISTCFKIFTSGKYVEIAKKVRDFASRLAEISVNRGNEIFSANKFTVVQLKHHSNMIQLLTLLFNNITVVHSKLNVLVKSEVYLKELRSVLHVSKGADMLNYLGFRALLHISPLLPDQAVQLAAIQMKEITGIHRSQWPRWRRCLRMFERVAPTVFLMTYAQTHRRLANKDKVWLLLNEIQASFVLNINTAPWMSIEDKVMLKDKLSRLKLEVFHKFWARSNRKRSVGDFLPDFESGSIISMYKSLAKQLMTRKLSKIKLRRSYEETEWKGSVFDTDPVFDQESDSIFIPMAMFDPSYMIDSESMLLQVPRVATKIIGVLFKAIHHHNIPSDKVKWSLDTELGYHDVQKCLQRHYGNTKNNEKLRTQITAELSILDSMAILPAFKLFLKKVNKVNIEDYGVLTGLNITVKQLFFILYAKGLCETMDSKREKEVMDESALNIGSLRVNVPLRNSFRFPTFWDCSSDSLMNPHEKCTIWTS
ncbi:hypothetical protein HPB47_006559 [Ixodes persulcatus]|uniref:Uncharacterized protein n=1 Tax=Ixodes persulcatus TaxID=34615 RepID=A0AC60P9T4_IXOPE|nr:hypothetical protein HPB47_006559 [Ixodes persulcatus]